MTADKGKMLKGIALAIAAGICWGSMGATAQFLMRDFGFAPLDLVTLRIFTAGIVLLVLHAVTGGGNIFEPLKKHENLRDILLASATVLFAQYSFIQGIHYSNAGTAAVVITTVPLFVCVWLAFSERRPVRAVEMLCFLLATGGVVLLVTKGDFSTLDFSIKGVMWALGCAIASAVYSIQPRAVLGRVGVTLVVGWSMVFGGLAASLFDAPWHMHVHWSGISIAAFLFLVLVGTVGAVWCYMASLKCISPVVVGLLGCSEPLTAVVLSVVLLGVHLGVWELVGMAMVLSTVVLLALPALKADRQPY